MKPENLKCPLCQGPMISRLNKKQNSRFWGCAAYPMCRGTRDVDGKSKEERESEHDTGWKDERALDEDEDGRKY